MNFDSISIIRIKDISADDFFNLIERNRSYLELGFPYTILKCSDKKSTASYLKEKIQFEDDKKLYNFYLRDLKSDILIGYINIKNINFNASKCEFGYFIDQSYQGNNITSKAIHKIIPFCFEKLKMNKIFICTDKKNIGSQKVAIKNGFIREGILRKEFKDPKGRFHDVVYFGLLKTDYYQNLKG